MKKKKKILKELNEIRADIAWLRKDIDDVRKWTAPPVLFNRYIEHKQDMTEAQKKMFEYLGGYKDETTQQE